MYKQLSLTSKDIQLIIRTNFGDIKCALFPEEAPKAVENMKELAKKNYYDGIIFHRVIKDFMIQTGDPTGTGHGGESIWGKSFDDEITDSLHHFYGALSMANSGPNSNGSQFFIVQMKDIPSQNIPHLKSLNLPKDLEEEYFTVGGSYWLDGYHTVFGQVVDGMEVVEEIASLPTDAQDRPMLEVRIEMIEVL